MTILAAIGLLAIFGGFIIIMIGEIDSNHALSAVGFWGVIIGFVLAIIATVGLTFQQTASEVETLRTQVEQLTRELGSQ